MLLPGISLAADQNEKSVTENKVEHVDEGRNLESKIAVEFIVKNGVHEVNSILVEPSEGMTCGQLLKSVQLIEKISKRACAIQITRENKIIEIALYPGHFRHIDPDDPPQTINLGFMEDKAHLDGVEIATRDGDGVFRSAKYLSEVDDFRKKQQLGILYIWVAKDTKISDILLVLNMLDEISAGPFKFKFLSFMDMDGRTL